MCSRCRRGRRARQRDLAPRGSFGSATASRLPPEGGLRRSPLLGPGGGVATLALPRLQAPEVASLAPGVVRVQAVAAVVARRQAAYPARRARGGAREQRQRQDGGEQRKSEKCQEHRRCLRRQPPAARGKKITRSASRGTSA